MLPELHQLRRASPATPSRLAVDGYREDQTTFVDVRSFGPSAKAAGERLHSGDLVEVSGSLEYDQWEAKDGSGKRSKLYIVGRIGFCSSASGTTRSKFTQEPGRLCVRALAVVS